MFQNIILMISVIQLKDQVQEKQLLVLLHGTVARKFLENFGISVGSYVESIGGIHSKKKYLNNLLMNKTPNNFSAWKIAETADKSLVRVLDK
ncbi:MAG: hypothetical protein MZV64_06425 [Ignavibacteriales bacterium]|nr:hypothetical protein [Ignavibacteriales bacterium]